MREITPLTQNDCFTIFSRVKKEFNFPLHYHDEYELNLILNAKGAKRIVGDHIDEIDDVELVLVGPTLSHAWFTHHCTSGEIKEITIQWHKDLFDEKFSLNSFGVQPFFFLKRRLKFEMLLKPQL